MGNPFVAVCSSLLRGLAHGDQQQTSTWQGVGLVMVDVRHLRPRKGEELPGSTHVLVLSLYPLHIDARRDSCPLPSAELLASKHHHKPPSCSLAHWSSVLRRAPCRQVVLRGAKALFGVERRKNKEPIEPIEFKNVAKFPSLAPCLLVSR